MKRTVLFSAAILIALATFAQDITGEWNGALKIQGMQLRLVFHIAKNEAGYSATMDSPDQGAKGLPVNSISFKDQVLSLEITSINMKYKGTLENSGYINGSFEQAGQSLPLVLSRKAVEKVELKRPQEPSKPYSYYSEEVTFLNPKDNITLAGTLTLPAKNGKFPVVVLISGSGAQNRDEELFGHKPFLVLADYLTRNGIGVLRYDDRGSFASKGNFATATTNDLATDVQAAVNYLKTRKEINPKKIGLVGHSEGGIIAPMVAAKSKDVSFIVLMAGTAIPGSELLLLQQEMIGRASGIPEDNLKKTRELNSAVYKMVDQIQNADTLRAKASAYLLDHCKNMPEMKVPEGKTMADMINLQINQLTSPWMLNFIRYNPAPTLEKVKCPVLVINGDKDLQVPSKVNLSAIENALKKGGNKKYSIKELPGLNHLFQECQSGLPAEYAVIDQTISPKALETILNWVKLTIK